MLTAIIDESSCIGCSRCLPVCPVDAIIGTRQHMHTVLIDECIGCKLCVNPCPVDCITMVPLSEKLPPNAKIDKHARAQTAKKRHLAKKQRIAAEEPLKLPVYSSKEERKTVIKNYIQSALKRQAENKKNIKELISE